VTAASPVGADRIAASSAVFDGLWERHHDAIYGYCCHLTDAHRGADLTQDVFLDAFRALLDGRFDGRNERAWLFRNASRKAIDRWRLGWGRYVLGSLERLFQDVFSGSDERDHEPTPDWQSGSHRRAGAAALTAPAGWAEGVCVDDAAADRAAVAAAVRRLPPDHRAVLWLREWQDMDYDQISRVLGVTRSATRSLLRRARTRLREEWRKQEALA